jgi:hypothetical protein
MIKTIRILLSLRFVISCCLLAAQTGPSANDWKAVEQALGRPGQSQADGAYKFGLPRGDLTVTVNGLQVKPTLALGSWIAFSNPAHHAMVMGDPCGCA